MLFCDRGPRVIVIFVISGILVGILVAISSQFRLSGRVSLRHELPANNGKVLGRTDNSKFFGGLPSPSWLVAVASMAGGMGGTSLESKSAAHETVIMNVASMCEAGLNVALLIDTAGWPRNHWQSIISRYGCGPRGGRACGSHETPLWCERRGGAVEVKVREFPTSLAADLCSQFIPVFKANLERFDWFVYSDEDIAWTPRIFLAFAAEYDILRREGNLNTIGALPSVIRWEAHEKHTRLNDMLERRIDGVDKLNDVSFNEIICIDCNYGPLEGVRTRIIGNETYIEPVNPLSSMFILPNDVMTKRWSMLEADHEGVYTYEFTQGGWLWTCPVAEYCSKTAVATGLRMIIPCSRAHDFLVMHMSGGKFTRDHVEKTPFVEHFRKVCAGH